MTVYYTVAYCVNDQRHIGNLRFTNIEPWDANNDTSYVCVIYNPSLRNTVQGGDQRIALLRHPTS